MLTHIMECSVLSSPTWFDSGYVVRQSIHVHTSVPDVSDNFHIFLRESIWETTSGKRLRIELAATHVRDTTVPIYRWSLLVLISTTGGLAPHDQDSATQLVAGADAQDL